MAVSESPRLLAVYGMLMRGLGGLEQLGLVDVVRLLGPCVIEGRLFDLGAYPGLVPGAGRVRGELVEVRDERALAELDRFEGFDPANRAASLYLREEVRLLSPDRVAMLYVYNGAWHQEQEVVSGDWRLHLAQRGDHES